MVAPARKKAVTSGPNYSVILSETLWNVKHKVCIFKVGNKSAVELFALSQGKWMGIFRCNACQETNTLPTGTLGNYVSDA